MIAILFVACDNNNNNNNDDNNDNNDSVEVDGSGTASSDAATEQVTMDGGEEFANDNEAIYKDSWK